MLTAAGMVAVVNSVVIAAFVGLVLEATGVRWLAVPLACGAAIGVGAFVLHERHHRRALIAYRPEAVDRAAIFRHRKGPTRPDGPVHESEEHHRSIEVGAERNMVEVEHVVVSTAYRLHRSLRAGWIAPHYLLGSREVACQQ